MPKRTLYHVSPKGKRELIEKFGLRAKTPKLSYDMPKGVYMSEEAPHADYGDDVYEVTPKKYMGIRQDSTDFRSVYSQKSVGISDFKRVGHVFRNPNGHAEVHWHPEEQCND